MDRHQQGLVAIQSGLGQVYDYYLSDGLSGNEFYRRNGVFKSKSGELFFSSTGGLAAFFPDQVIESSDAPPVVLTDFLLAYNSVRIADSSPLNQIHFADHIPDP